MKPPYDTKAVANYILELAEAEGKAITPMQLQKLVYFAHGWHLAITGEPLIKETVEAWKWGPVIKSLYHDFKDFGSGPILNRARKVKLHRGPGPGLSGWKITTEIPTLENADPISKDIIERVWKKYSSLSAVRLSALTHQPDSPWHRVWAPMAANPIKGTDIPNESIREHFLAQAQAQTPAPAQGRPQA